MADWQSIEYGRWPMALRDSARGKKRSDDLLLQKIPDGQIAYRAVFHDPPQESDFFSHHETGMHPKLTMPYKAFAWLGVSMFTERGRADRFVGTKRERHEDAWVAEMHLTGGAGLYAVYTEKITHLEVFGLPRDLLDRFARVV